MMLRLWLKRLLALGRRRHYDQELADELAAHLELAERDAMSSGLSPAEAARQARLRFGAIERIREEHRDSRSLRSLERIARDARHAARSLLRSPAFTVTAVLTLALGIGAATAIFSVVYGVLLKPLPFPEPDRLVAIYHVTHASQRDFQGFAHYFTYRDHGQVFEDMGLWNAEDVSVTRGGEAMKVQALRVTDGTLPLLGVRAALGRLIQQADDVPGAPFRLLLTHGYWQDAFGAAPDIVGQPLVINDRPYEIIGVLPASFKLLDTNPQIVLPFRLNRANTRTGALFVNGLARLKSGVTLSDANADIARMIPLVTREFPLAPRITPEMWDSVGLAPNVRPLSEAVIGDMRRPLWILLGTAGIVLLLAWTNVASLLLVRAEGRQGELAVCRALGASRLRIASALLAESLLLGLAGGSAGIVFAYACVTLLKSLAPEALPRASEIWIDEVVLLVTLAVSVLTSLLFGLVPLRRSRVADVVVLKEAGRSTTDAPRRHRARHALVVTQMALAVVLLVVSGLMVRTFVAMRQVNPGFARPAEVQTFGIELRAAVIPDSQQVVRTYEAIAARLAQVPGVAAVGLGTMRLDGVAGKAPVYVRDQPTSGLPPIGSIRSIGPGYFETMGNPLVAGRSIGWTDIFQLRPVAVVSERVAREHWDAPRDAIGARIALFPEGPWLEVVGVAGDVRADGLNHPAPPLVYLPMADAESVSRNMGFLVRSTRVGPPGFERELEQAVWSVRPGVPLADLTTLDVIQAASMSQTTFAMTMLTVAAGGALLLALVGIYGAVSYIVAERTHEVGIRMALGADGGSVRRLFLWQGAALTIVGIVLGVSAALLLTPVMSALLYGVAATDPVTYVSVAVLLGTATLLATYLPARRASRLSPTVALRSRS